MNMKNHKNRRSPKPAVFLQTSPTLIGVVHLAPLPGAPRAAVSMDTIVADAIRDAVEYERAGFDAVIVENFGDAPFYPGPVPPETLAALSIVANAVRSTIQIPTGVNCLRNDGLGAMAIAAAARLQFIRINVLSGAVLADQGIVISNAHDVLRARARLAPNVKILADVAVKHARPLADRPVEDEARDLVHRALADAVIVSGSHTGDAPGVDFVRRVVRAVRGAVPVLIGSGLSASNVAEFFTKDRFADGLPAGVAGAIVGTSVKKNAKTTEPVDRRRALELAAAVRA